MILKPTENLRIIIENDQVIAQYKLDELNEKVASLEALIGSPKEYTYDQLYEMCVQAKLITDYSAEKQELEDTKALIVEIT